MQNSAHPRFTRGLPGMVLLLGLLLTGMVWQVVCREVQQDQQERFDGTSAYVTELMEDRLQRSVEIVLGFVGLFQVSDQVSRAEFAGYARMMQLDRRAPGLIAAQYAPLVPASRRAEFEAATRADVSVDAGGYPGFAIHPPGERPFHLPVLYNEPMERNRAAFGHDTAADPARRAVMEQALQRGAPTFSPPLQLLQGEAGVVIRAPVYRRGMPVGTEAERRAAFAGLISGVFRVGEVIQNAMPRQLGGIRARVVDAAAQSDDAPLHQLYDSGPLPGELEDGPMLRHRQAILIAGRVWLVEISAPSPPAYRHPMAISVIVGGLGLTLPMFAVARGLTRRATRASAEAERLYHGAHHDALTGLANRRGLMLRIAALLAPESAEAALLFIDLDRFKAINDRHGHEMGDDVLRVIAARLRSCLRPEDLVARLGGDEFVVLLGGEQARRWPAVRERVMAAVCEPIVAQGTTMAVGASIGVALAPEDGRDAATLLRHADRQMYEVKTAGRRSA